MHLPKFTCPVYFLQSRERLHKIFDRGKFIGLLEPLTDRLLALTSVVKTSDVDIFIRNNITKSPLFDFSWLSSFHLQTIWNTYIEDQFPSRYVRVKTAHLAFFDPQFGKEFYGEDEEDNFLETRYKRKASSFDIIDRTNEVSNLLKVMQENYPPAKVIKMLSIPDVERGGYDFWSWGKVTHRSSSFRNGLEQITFIGKVYEETTKIIEQETWFNTEKVNIQDGSTNISIRGAPIVIEFNTPLKPTIFKEFVRLTFDIGVGPFRLWGTPLVINENKVRIYALDMHLWQKIYLEITPERMVAIIPKGTCGNTIHRLVSNIQHYLAPSLTVSIGNLDYFQLIQSTFRGKQSPNFGDANTEEHDY